ncbi:MAG: hypothetical protein EON55_16055 [Alphaproteobacteria bacterium]|nr:MAG: hypothetical protein EON55_16055 [Alphaproteobacteria bacterium]
MADTNDSTGGKLGDMTVSNDSEGQTPAEEMISLNADASGAALGAELDSTDGEAEAEALAEEDAAVREAQLN